MEVLLVEDYKFQTVMPPIISRMVHAFFLDITKTDRNDILTGVIYLLALECGFVPVELKGQYKNSQFNYSQVLSLSSYCPVEWKYKHFSRFALALPGCEAECNLHIIPLQEDCIVDMTYGSQMYKTIIDPLTYFTSSKTDISMEKLQNLNHLSKLLKDDVINPCKQQILHNNNQRVACLEDIPHEAKLQICSYLSGSDLVRLGMTSKCFYEVQKDVFLWKECLKKEFLTYDVPEETYELLKAEYSKMYINQKRRQKILTSIHR